MGLHEGMIFVTKRGVKYLIGSVEGNSIKIYPQSLKDKRYKFSNIGRYVDIDFIDRNAIRFIK